MDMIAHRYHLWARHQQGTTQQESGGHRKASAHSGYIEKHAAKVSLRDNNFQRIQDARVAMEAVLITVVQTNTDLTIPLAAFQNGIEYAAAKHSEPLDIILQGDAKVEHEVNWRTYQDRQSRLDKQRGQHSQ